MSKKILVVDNDPDLVDSVKTLLESKGYSVSGAYSGEEGIEKANSEKPDLIFLDVMMSTDSEGLDTAVKLRDSEATSDIPVIFLTGIRKPEFLTSSYRPGEDFPNVKATMEKPVKPEEIFKKIEKAVK
ncbi:MAG: PleD family two-component system response regulator [Fibrobacterota bacterium]